MEKRFKAISTVANILEIAQERNGLLLAVKRAVQHHTNVAVFCRERLDHQDATVPAYLQIISGQVVVHKLTGRFIKTSY